MVNPDDIHAALNHVAGSIDAGDMETARTDVRNTLNRRRRRTRIAASLGATVLLVGGVVAFVSFDNSDDPATLVGVDPTTTTVAEAAAEDEADDAPATTQPEAATAPATQPSQSTAAAVVGGQGTSIAAPTGNTGNGSGAQWAVAWKDGFLVGGQTFEPQPLPSELPEEVTALFPDEVTALFPDGLPPTVAEATEILSEAGLLGVVTEIINSNSEASAAILGEPVAAPTFETYFSVDGTSWESVEMNLPDEVAYVQSAVGVGDRLVVLSAPDFGPLGQQGPVVVASTTDLITWEVQTIEVPPPPIELPDYVSRYVGPQNLVANESGWVISVFDSIDVNIESLLPDDAFDPEGGFGYGTTDEGVEIHVGEQEGEPVRYTWDELGVAPEVVELMNGGRFNQGNLWTASWDGVPVRSELSREFGGSIIATDAGFISLAEQSWFSEDGVSWVAADLPGVRYAYEYMKYDGGLIVVGADEEGLSALYRVDSRGQSAERLDLPGLPEQLHGVGYSESASAAIVFDVNVPEINTDPLVLQADGYELTWTQNNGAFELRDATGEVVLSEDWNSSGVPPEDSSFAPSADGFSFSDPETGEVLVLFPTEVVKAAFEEQFGSPEEFEDYNPDLRMLATADGERFIVDDIDGGFEFGPILTVINGNTLLVQSGSEWTRYNLP